MASEQGSERWVVYQVTLRGEATPRNAVCTQQEWDALRLAQPDRHTLIRDCMASEGEAERLARGTSGDPVKRPPSRS